MSEFEACSILIMFFAYVYCGLMVAPKRRRKS